jgi:hypothetical protein
MNLFKLHAWIAEAEARLALGLRRRDASTDGCSTNSSMCAHLGDGQARGGHCAMEACGASRWTSAPQSRRRLRETVSSAASRFGRASVNRDLAVGVGESPLRLNPSARFPTVQPGYGAPCSATAHRRTSARCSGQSGPVRRASSITRRIQQISVAPRSAVVLGSSAHAAHLEFKVKLDEIGGRLAVWGTGVAARPTGAAPGRMVVWAQYGQGAFAGGETVAEIRRTRRPRDGTEPGRQSGR